jgi:hypothetical protein
MGNVGALLPFEIAGRESAGGSAPCQPAGTSCATLAAAHEGDPTQAYGGPSVTGSEVTPAGSVPFSA